MECILAPDFALLSFSGLPRSARQGSLGFPEKLVKALSLWPESLLSRSGKPDEKQQSSKE